DFAGDVLGELDRRGPERVIIDLRHNGGGRSALMAPLIDGLRQRAVGRRHGRLFCLIGNRTSSSAALNALQLRRATAAVLVGEPTGQKPNSFGEMRWFR